MFCSTRSHHNIFCNFPTSYICNKLFTLCKSISHGYKYQLLSNNATQISFCFNYREMQQGFDCQAMSEVSHLMNRRCSALYSSAIAIYRREHPLSAAFFCPRHQRAFKIRNAAVARSHRCNKSCCSTPSDCINCLLGAGNVDMRVSSILTSFPCFNASTTLFS